MKAGLILTPSEVSIPSTVPYTIECLLFIQAGGWYLTHWLVPINRAMRWNEETGDRLPILCADLIVRTGRIWNHQTSSLLIRIRQRTNNKIRRSLTPSEDSSEELNYPRNGRSSGH